MTAVELGDRRPTDMMNTMLSQLPPDEPAGKLFLALYLQGSRRLYVSEWRPNISLILSSWPSTRILSGRPSRGRLSPPPFFRQPSRVRRPLRVAAVP